MITYKEFEDIVVNILKRDISSNEDQKKSIKADANESLFLVAGPGSGKTTVMVLKILKYIFVDDITPQEILATTFTKKAADELYSRMLGWGDEIKTYLIDEYGDDFEKIAQLARVDFNQINIGTTDSIAEELLRVHREPGTNQSIVIERFVAQYAMVKILLKDNRYLDENLVGYLKSFTKKELKEPSQMSEMILEIKNRMYYDMVDIDDVYQNMGEGGGVRLVLNCIKDYENELKERNVIDFAMLEDKFLNELKNHKLDMFLDDIKIVLIDEYQDTNLIQEEIYFTIAESAINNNGSITVVGDDDQSLYRFRGATVDLFTNFKQRAKDKLNIDVKEINLRTNYRSTENIINHCNNFVELDKEYQNARVERKPKIIAPDFEKDKMPILGLFRNNPKMLAHDVSRLIGDLVNKGETEQKVLRVIDKEFFKKMNRNLSIAELQKIREEDIKKGKKQQRIRLKLDEETGSASDISVLTYSPKEMKGGNPTFNYYLRKNLKKLRQPIEVFNPRGRDLQEIEEVRIFCGLMLECIDPGAIIQEKDKTIPQLAKRNIRIWRSKARDFIKMNPKPHQPLTLSDFVTSWQLRKAKTYKDGKVTSNDEWPQTASLMELAYKLITWIESLQEDVEGVVYLEAITQSITQTGFFNKYSANISFVDKQEEQESILEAIWNIFVPIATGGVEIEEELLDTLPEDRLNLMSIHQSKGLEFPLVIVDVASRFSKNDVRTQNLRYPKKPPEHELIEESIRKLSSLGSSKRKETDKSFDDLTRLYFVAYSRAESVLILIGLNSAIEGYFQNDKHRSIPNVALGWSRDGNYIGFDEIYLI